MIRLEHAFSLIFGLINSETMQIHRTFLAFYSLLTLLGTGNLAEIPHPPVNFHANDVGPGFIQLAWTPVPGDDIQYYKLQYREKGDINGFIEERTNLPGLKVQNLSPFTEYQFQVVGVNSLGDSRPTDIVEKRTSPMGLYYILLVVLI